MYTVHPASLSLSLYHFILTWTSLKPHKKTQLPSSEELGDSVGPDGCLLPPDDSKISSGRLNSVSSLGKGKFSSSSCKIEPRMILFLSLLPQLITENCNPFLQLPFSLLCSSQNSKTNMPLFEAALLNGYVYTGEWTSFLTNQIRPGTKCFKFIKLVTEVEEKQRR